MTEQCRRSVKVQPMLFREKPGARFLTECLTDQKVTVSMLEVDVNTVVRQCSQTGPHLAEG